jgi:hypothetical protein
VTAGDGKIDVDWLRVIDVVMVGVLSSGSW